MSHNRQFPANRA